MAEQKRLDRKELREALAELEHKQWVTWSQAIADEVSTSRRARWRNLWIPYKDLTEEQKDQDREWAVKFLALIEPLIEEAKKQENLRWHKAIRKSHIAPSVEREIMQALKEEK